MRPSIVARAANNVPALVTLLSLCFCLREGVEAAWALRLLFRKSPLLRLHLVCLRIPLLVQLFKFRHQLQQRLPQCAMTSDLQNFDSKLLLTHPSIEKYLQYFF
jgi:hypothetical protein